MRFVNMVQLAFKVVFQLKYKSFAKAKDFARGFSLMEVLIALLIVSVGFLGVAGLNSSYRLAQDALNRQTASIIAMDLSNRIKMNRVNASAYNNLTSSSSVPQQDCVLNACTPAQLVQYDWNAIRNHAATLPNGRISVCISDRGRSNLVCEDKGTNVACNNQSTPTPPLAKPNLVFVDPQYCAGSIGNSFPVYIITVSWTGLNGRTQEYLVSVTP